MPFFDGTARGVILVPRCDACGRSQWPPRPVCRRCGADTFGWVQVAPRGELYSWTTTYRAPTPEWADQVPYTVVVVTIGEPDSVRMVGRLTAAAAPATLRIGQSLTARFHSTQDGPTLVLWELSSSSEGPVTRNTFDANSNSPP
jgi:uncharacterized OB-fold protein